MFYFDETKAKYPHKGILEDAIKRNTLDENSYSPIIDQVWNELYSFKDEKAFGAFPIEGFPRTAGNFKDVTLFKMEELFKRSTSSDNNEPTREDIISLDDDAVIEKIVEYAHNIMWGWFYKNDSGARGNTDKYETEKYIRLKDNSDSDIYVSATELIEESIEDSLDEKDKIKYVARLTYYLKLIQECSIAKEVSILQIIIAESKIGRNASLIVKEGIAKIGLEGNIVDYYGPNHNTSKKWNEFWSWYTSEKRDMWGQIVDEFKTICKKLNIDLRNENYKDFTPKVVNNLMCVYLASNEEYLDTIGRGDSKVFEMLEPSRLFDVRSKVPGFKQDWMYIGNDLKFVQAYISKLEQVQLRYELDEHKWIKGKDDVDTFTFLTNRQSTVKEFFDIFANLMNFNDAARDDMNSWYYNDFNILCVKTDHEEVPVSISKGTLCNRLGFINAPEKICFTINGLAISKVSGQDGAFRHCEVSQLISLMETGVNNAYPDGKIECI